MKIILRSKEGPNLTIPLPNRFLFSPTLLQLVNWTARKSIPEFQAPNIPPQAVKALYAEIRKIKKVHKEWYLLDLRSAEGDTVQIKL